MLNLGNRRTTESGQSLLKLFGLNGTGVSFDCDACGQCVENRLPVRSGADAWDERENWFCSFPCAWVWHSQLNLLLRWVDSQGEAFWQRTDPVATLARGCLNAWTRPEPCSQS